MENWDSCSDQSSMTSQCHETHLEEEEAECVPLSCLWRVRGEIDIGPKSAFGLFHVVCLLYLDQVVKAGCESHAGQTENLGEY
jgi:hypothetical protein